MSAAWRWRLPVTVRRRGQQLAQRDAVDVHRSELRPFVDKDAGVSLRRVTEELPAPHAVLHNTLAFIGGGPCDHHRVRHTWGQTHRRCHMTHDLTWSCGHHTHALHRQLSTLTWIWDVHLLGLSSDGRHGSDRPAETQQQQQSHQSSDQSHEGHMIRAQIVSSLTVTEDEALTAAGNVPCSLKNVTNIWYLFWSQNWVTTSLMSEIFYKLLIAQNHFFTWLTEHQSGWRTILWQKWVNSSFIKGNDTRQQRSDTNITLKYASKQTLN